MDILYEDNHILVCYKPAGIKTQTAKISEKDLVSEINNYLNKEAKRAGKKACPIFLIHRLDEPVAGILVFAKTKDDAAYLNSQIRDGVLKKSYYAVVSGNVDKIVHVDNNRIILEDFLIKDSNKAYVTDKNNKEAKKAILEYKIVSVGKNAPGFLLNDGCYCLLDILLHTGRYHQIRCQLSNAGFPIVGDVTYGGEEITDLITKRKGIGLIAYKLCFIHPKTHKIMEFTVDDSNLSRFIVE